MTDQSPSPAEPNETDRDARGIGPCVRPLLCHDEPLCSFSLKVVIRTPLPHTSLQELSPQPTAEAAAMWILLPGQGGKSPHSLHSRRNTETCVKNKVKVLIQLFYSSKSEKVQALKSTQSINSFPNPLLKCNYFVCLCHRPARHRSSVCFMKATGPSCPGS